MQKEKRKQSKDEADHSSAKYSFESRSNQHMHKEKPNVFINGKPIPDRLVKRAEKLAGPIQPGDYWYDFQAGFWGVTGQPCAGIIPPFIEEFNYPMPENCAAGNTGVFVNGRELHQKDLDRLSTRGLPITRQKFYIVDVSGRVFDEDNGEELDRLGRLAPTVEKAKRGFGMKVPRKKMEPLERGSFHERPSFNQADELRGDPSQPTNDQLCSPSVNNDVIVNDAQNVVGVRTEPVVQQSNAGLDNLSVDAGRTQVGVQGMEQCGEEGRVCSHLDMENNVGRNGGSDAKIRLVRCPKCGNVLVEPKDIPVYTCGGCSTYLRAKIRKSNPEVATSGLHETDDDQKNTSAGAGSTNKEVTNAISASAQQQRNEMMMAHQREDLSLEDCPITAEEMEIGSFHDWPSFNQADEPRGDPSQPTNDQLYSPSVALPIFYDTAPSDVCKQTGSYAKAFDKHEEHFKEEMEKVNRRREALAQAANLPGWGLNNETKGSNQHMHNEKPNVFINGKPIPDRLVKRAEKLAGPIQPGDYWYDVRAGFWGVTGQPCAGIIPPFIEEFNYPMPENCAAGNTGVFVNGRELHQKDLDRLSTRGLPITRQKFYIVEVSGRVFDEDTGEELDRLGRLAPTVEKAKRGFGMKVPMNEMEPLERVSFHERPSFNQADEPRGDPSQPPNDQLCSPSVNNDLIVNDAQQREPMFTREYEWANDFIGGGIEVGRYTPETIPITEQANPETEFARDHCSPEELPHDEFQTLSRTEPVVQVLEQSKAERDNLSVDAGRTQVGFQGMEQGEEEGRVFSHFDLENTGEGSVQLVDRIVPPMIEENYNRREATKILVQPAVCASAFVFYGDINAISTSQQEQNNEVDNVAGDAGTTPAAATRDHIPGRFFKEFSRWLKEEDEDEEPGEDEELLGPGRKRMAQLKSGWTLLMTSLILELASAVFDQLGYAFVGMVLAYVALLVATADLIHMARKERMRQLPISHRTSTATFVPGKPGGTIVEYFGLVGGVWQCFHSTVAYAYTRQKKDNPIKMSLLPLIFLSCVVISKLKENISLTRVLRKGIFLTPEKPLYFG